MKAALALADEELAAKNSSPRVGEESGAEGVHLQVVEGSGGRFGA
jgi:hypothetical protein